MLENNSMGTPSTEVTSIRRRSNFEKSTWRTHRYFVGFKSRIHVEISSSNRCHNFHVDSSLKIDVILTNFPRKISTSNRWRSMCPWEAADTILDTDSISEQNSFENFNSMQPFHLKCIEETSILVTHKCISIDRNLHVLLSFLGLVIPLPE